MLHDRKKHKVTMTSCIFLHREKESKMNMYHLSLQGIMAANTDLCDTETDVSSSGGMSMFSFYNTFYQL